MIAKLIVKRLIVGQLQTNCYIVADRNSGEGIVVDPGDNAEYIENVIRDLGVQPTKIVATHGHFDHILAAFELQQAYRIPFLIHPEDEFLVKRMRETACFFLKIEVPDFPPQINNMLKERDVISIGQFNLQVIKTPGHTPGSVCLYCKENQLLFTGDTIFAAGGVGRTDFNYSKPEKLDKSIRKILKFSAKTRLYPGHGDESTVADEQSHHLFARKDN